MNTITNTEKEAINQIAKSLQAVIIGDINIENKENYTIEHQMFDVNGFHHKLKLGVQVDHEGQKHFVYSDGELELEERDLDTAIRFFHDIVDEHQAI